jgi:hypothetical protein
MKIKAPLHQRQYKNPDNPVSLSLSLSQRVAFFCGQQLPKKAKESKIWLYSTQTAHHPLVNNFPFIEKAIVL